jgi:hypothetical protein
MTDRELLELAAKAAGMQTFGQDNSGALCIDPVDYVPWNPLTDDGDVLRLAVKCGIVVEYRRDVPMAFAYHYALNLEIGERNSSLDPYAATRRAIVRAAAEIGKSQS